MPPEQPNSVQKAIVGLAHKIMIEWLHPISLGSAVGWTTVVVVFWTSVYNNFIFDWLNEAPDRPNMPKKDKAKVSPSS